MTMLTISTRPSTLRWFDKRKGLAAGVIFSGGGVGGAVSPLDDAKGNDLS
jgi:hypothetical protein